MWEVCTGMFMSICCFQSLLISGGKRRKRRSVLTSHVHRDTNGPGFRALVREIFVNSSCSSDDKCVLIKCCKKWFGISFMMMIRIGTSGLKLYCVQYERSHNPPRGFTQSNSSMCASQEHSEEGPLTAKMKFSTFWTLEQKSLNREEFISGTKMTFSTVWQGSHSATGVRTRRYGPHFTPHLKI